MLTNWNDAQPPAASPVSPPDGTSGQITNLLARRNIEGEEAIRQYLNPNTASLTDPFDLCGMKVATRRLQMAIQNKEPILIYGDYDCDGITGSAILSEALRRLGAAVDVFIPDRRKEGYGLEKKALKKHALSKAKIVVTVDNGITGVDEVGYLNKNNIDVIVVDHHKPKDKLPDAMSIVTGDRIDGEKHDDLAACGLAFKLAWALGGSFEWAREHLDLVAIGTIADLAPLTGENRTLVWHGLKELRVSKKKGIQALLTISGIRNLSSEDIAFQIAPRINSAGRIAKPREAFNLLVTLQANEAGNLAQLLDEGNRIRKTMELQTVREAVAQVEAGHHFGHYPVIVVHNEAWHEGIMGIVAMRLAERYHRPAFAIASKDGVGKGSGRSIPGFSLFDIMMKCSDCFIKFGGHAAACGLTISTEKITDFRESINQIAKTLLDPGQLTPRVAVDAKVDLSALTQDFLTQLTLMEPFGIGNPEPRFITRFLRVKNRPRFIGGEGCVFWVEDLAGGRVAEAISFRKKFGFQKGDLVDIVYSPARHLFDGVENLRLRVRDAQSAKPAGGRI